jgi:hypothetical protein
LPGWNSSNENQAEIDRLLDTQFKLFAAMKYNRFAVAKYSASPTCAGRE